MRVCSTLSADALFKAEEADASFSPQMTDFFVRLVLLSQPTFQPI